MRQEAYFRIQYSNEGSGKYIVLSTYAPDCHATYSKEFSACAKADSSQAFSPHPSAHQAKYHRRVWNDTTRKGIEAYATSIKSCETQNTPRLLPQPQNPHAVHQSHPVNYSAYVESRLAAQHYEFARSPSGLLY